MKKSLAHPFFCLPQSGQKMSLKKSLPEGPCFRDKKKTASRSAVFFRRRYFLLWGIAKNYIMYWGFLRLLLYVIFVQKCAQICIFFTSFFVYISQYVFFWFPNLHRQNCYFFHRVSSGFDRHLLLTITPPVSILVLT